jgi:hypothetical protein
VVQPNQDLVTLLLDQMELRNVVDEDGDVVTPWQGFRAYFMFRGDDEQFFLVRTFYDRAYSLDTKSNLLELVDEWNRETLWPKVYTHTSDDGVVRLIGESQMVVTGGVVLAQFAASVVNWVQASIEFDRWIAQCLGSDATDDEDDADESDGDAGPPS